MLRLTALAALVPLLPACGTTAHSAGPQPAAAAAISPHLVGLDADQVDWRAKTDAWWSEHLSAEQLRVCRQAGTERPGSGALLHEKSAGVFTCSSCGFPLFSSDDKFDSGTGWPSFTRPIAPAALAQSMDASLGMLRTEVRCGRCDAHLGHVFDDGPAPTGQRYCINSVCLNHRAK